MNKFIKAVVAILLAVLVNQGLLAQTAPAIQWQKSLGGSGYDLASAILQTADGGYIVAGRSPSTDGDVKGGHGGDDFWLVKLNSKGDTLWQKSLGGSGDDRASCIQQTADGGYIVAGATASIDGDVTGNHKSADFWVVKLTSTGSLQWQKSLGGRGDDGASAIRQTTDGGYIVVGAAKSGYGGLVDGDLTGNHGVYDYWVVKLNSTGGIQWQKNLGGSGTDIAYSVQQAADGGYIVAGTSDSNDGDVTGNHGSADYWVVKLNASGGIVWQKSLGGESSDNGSSSLPVLQTTDGGYLVAGQSSSFGGDVTGNHGAFDTWVVKLDGTGNIQWQNCYGGSNYDNANSLQQTSDGGYILAGSTSSSDGDVTSIWGSYDYWVVKLNNTGAIQWQKSFGGSNADFANDVRQTLDGGYIVAGYSQSIDHDVTGNHGSMDYWVVKLAADGSGTTGSRATDSLALVDFYNSTGGPNWTNNSGWLAGPLSGWYGVVLDSNKRVSGISLASNNLFGTLPTSTGTLTNLQNLTLGSNQLSGSLPTSLGSLAKLQTLDVGFNQLSGTIPPGLGSLANLQYLYLNTNQLSGSIPTTLGSLVNLKVLYLYSNQLTGTLPNNLGSLAGLYYFVASGNKLSGSIPSSLGGLNKLVTLDFSLNQFADSIPSSFGNLTNLQGLMLQGNKLSGVIPATLGNLANLNYLYLYANQLTGPIPSSLGGLANLNRLDLSGNQLNGIVPATLGNAKNLRYMDVSSNLLSGSVPSSLTGLPYLNTLSLRKNYFNFDGLELISQKYSFASYDLQYFLLPIHINTKLSVTAGGTLANNTYKWYNGGTLAGTVTGDSTFAPSSPGRYSVVVTNAVAKALTLYSDTVTTVVAAPGTFSYISPNTYTVGVAITPLTPNVLSTGGGVTSYSITPALPAGLVFNTATGAISGRPSAVSVATTYTVTATNAAGTAASNVSITINSCNCGGVWQ